MQNPYSSSRDAEMIFHASGGAPATCMNGASRLPHNRSSPAFFLPGKRPGSETPPAGDGEETRFPKKARLKDARQEDHQISAKASLLQSQIPLARPFGSLPDAALARFLAETQHPQQSPSYGRRFYPSAGFAGPPLLLSGSAGGFNRPLVDMPEAMMGFRHSVGLMGTMGYSQVPMAFSASSLGQMNSHPFLQQQQHCASLSFPMDPNGRHSLDGKSSQEEAAALSSSFGTTATTTNLTNAIQTRRDDDCHAHFSKRVCISLATGEDPNWLSELQCFVRGSLLEVCWASREDVAVRNASKKVSLNQVGIRCRFCAHKPAGARTQRSSAFPSSIPQLYQSFTMMLRDHFDKCTCVPSDVMEKYLSLKSSTCQGATEAKKYWSYAATKLGMVDSETGIIMNDSTRAAAKMIPAFGYVQGETAVTKTPTGDPVMLVKPEDQENVSEFLYTILSHFQKIKLLQSERKGNRKSLKVGLPGFGCRYCSEVGRFGMSRVFPARRRTLPVRIADMYDHICRCNVCPAGTKAELQRLRSSETQDCAQEKRFLDEIWERMGHI